MPPAGPPEPRSRGIPGLEFSAVDTPLHFPDIIFHSTTINHDHDAHRKEAFQDLIITLHQINTTVGDFDGNAARILAGAHKARSLGSDLAVFPEMALTGYPPLDLLEMRDFLLGAEKALEELKASSRGLSPALLFGTVLSRAEPGGGKPLQNAAVVIRDGKILGVHRKVLLPTYDVFDETRYFHPGDSLSEVTIEGNSLALSICEDIWNDKNYWNSRKYLVDPVEEFFRDGQKMPLINISASPYSRGKNRLRGGMICNAAKRHGIPILYVNLTGGNDSLIFDGQSMVVNARGQVCARAKDFHEDVLRVDLDDVSKNYPPPVEEQDEIEALYRALVLGLRDYVKKCGFRRVVFGLSGGIDSAITAVIAREALGAPNALGVLMPSPFTSESSIRDARILSENLGIPTSFVPIDRIFESYLSDLEGPLGGLPGDTTEENIQARIRGNILMAFSNKSGHLVLSTGNKSELATGYCTLYGDMSGGLAIINDLYKGEVFELARHINRHGDVIPPSVLEKPPSAELKPDQKDEDFLPPYGILDPVLKAYIDDGRTFREILGMGYPEETVRKILNMVETSEYKRQQAAPGLKVSWKAFGIGRRCPVAKSYRF